jgi:predicted lipoprotein with Yx(FWY)xxD motif
MSDPSATRRPARLTGIAGMAIVVVAALVACSSGATTPPSAVTRPAASPVAIVSEAPSASPSSGTASGSPAAASPSASSRPGRYGTGDATPTPAPTTGPTAKPTTGPTPKPTPKPASIVVKSRSTGIGTVLAGPNGMTLYTLKTDPANGSGCSGSCADNWPPLLVKVGTAVKGGSGVSGTFGTFARGGKRQVTYKGRALYYYAYDAYAGDTNGQGASNVWYVAKP